MMREGGAYKVGGRLSGYNDEGESVLHNERQSQETLPGLRGPSRTSSFDVNAIGKVTAFRYVDSVEPAGMYGMVFYMKHNNSVQWVSDHPPQYLMLMRFCKLTTVCFPTELARI